MGSESLIEFRLEDSGLAVSATVPNVFMPDAGTPFLIGVPRKRCFVFSAQS